MIDRLPQVDGAAVADIDPRTAFSSPQEIENAPGLSAVEKQQLLTKWAEFAKTGARSNPAVEDEAEKAHAELAEATARPGDASDDA